MNTAMTIAELLERSGSLSVPEAVAIVLSVIDCSNGDGGDLREPFGPPSPENIELDRDGSTVCTSSAATPAVSELAILLQSLLEHTPKLPGGLVYTMGRALLEVEAPPFDSIDEFARSIARFEEGERRDVLRSLYSRCDSHSRVLMMVPARPASARPQSPPSSPPEPLPAEATDRRLHGPRSDQLRRELRAADELLYARRLSDRSDVAGPSGEQAEDRSRRLWALTIPVAALIVAAIFLAPLRHRLQPPTAGAVPLPAVFAPAVASGLPGGTGPFRPGSPLGDSTASARHATESALPDVSGAAEIANVAERRTSQDDGWLVPALDVNHRPVFSPSFASNGSAVFFHTGGAADSTSALMAADTSSDQLRVMTILDDGARNYHVQLSPDGHRIAFDSDRDGDRGVYIANRDGTNVHRVSGPGFAAVPTWSPDGRRLAFVRAEVGDARVWNLWLLTLGSHSERLTNYQYGQPWAASWFPDGRRIAYTHDDRLYVMNFGTGKTDTYTTPIPGHLLQTPAVSPDGSHVAFQVSGNGVWLLGLPGGPMRCVLQDPTAEDLAWAPDSRRLAFHSRRDGQWGVYVMARRE